MAFDGFAMKCLLSELTDKLQKGRIERIYQPQSDTLLINLHTGGGRQKLLVSANPSNPRIHLSGKAESSQQHPPMFCMLLRKHLGSGTLVSIKQHGMDRVLEFTIKTTDELGVQGTKILVCEVMGRHSNIILLNGNREIIDAIKRVTPEMSSYRHVFPGVVYKYPPSQSKLDLTGVETGVLEKEFSIHIGVKAARAVANTLEGFGKPLAREFCVRSGIDPDKPLEECSVADLCHTASLFRDIIHKGDFSPVIYYRDSDAAYFCPIMLTHLNLPFKLQQNINTMLDNFYHQKLMLETVNQEKDRLNKVVKALIEKNTKKLNNRLQEFHDAEDKSHYKLYGELITANLYRLKERCSNAILEDYNKPDMPLIRIELDPDLTPLQNAQKFFSEYNHGKRAKENLKKLIRRTKKEISYLESLVYSIEKCTLWPELHEIRLELKSGGYIKPAKTKDRRKIKEKPHSPSKPLAFISRDNFTIFVGRNNRQNDYLTLKFARKDDVWLHTKDIPGSHVLIRSEGKDLPDTTLYQAALLAAYYSKARQSSSVPVDYTAVKNVSKPSGAKPGYVIYKNQKTIFVTPDAEEIGLIGKINNDNTAD
jgi:predicted ribosome quality control (RQC) complex YloA/Tae2 family protein